MLAVNLSFDSLTNYTNNVNWSTNSKDVFLLLIIVLSILIHVFILKKDKIFAWFLSFYPSYLLVLFFPFNHWLPQSNLEQLIWIKTASFITLNIFLTVIFSRAHIFNNTTSGIIARFVHSIVYGLLSAGLLICLLVTLLPLEFISQFSSFSQNVFNGDQARFIWLSLPLALMIFSIKISNGHKGPGRPPLE